MQSLIQSSVPVFQKHASRSNYNLISRLRAIGKNGDESSLAVGRYDTKFPAQLAACSDDRSAEVVLEEWLEHRVATLNRIQVELRKAWADAQVTPSNS